MSETGQKERVTFTENEMVQILRLSTSMLEKRDAEITRLQQANAALVEALEDGVETLEAMNLHDTPLYGRMRTTLESAFAQSAERT